MVNCTEVRPGNFYVWDGQLYLCQAIDLNKTAMAKMKVKLKSKKPQNNVSQSNQHEYLSLCQMASNSHLRLDVHLQ